MTADPGWEYQPRGGPYSVAELQRRFPQIDAVALAIREKCIASPIYLASTLLSPMWATNLFDRPSKAHRDVEAAMIAQRDTLYVAERSTAKTTLSCEIRSVWQLLKYPNDSGLLTHSSATNAKGLSHAVRLHFTKNERLRAFFPEYAMDQGDEGNILKWSVPCRTKGGQQESIETATPETATAGRHYDWICSSDWMNENSTPLYGLATVEKMNNLVALFSQVRAMLQMKAVNPRAYWAIDSNRWYGGDLADTIIKNDKSDRVAKIVVGVTGESGNFVSSWPEVRTSADIQAVWDDPSMTERAFAANYRSSPVLETGYAFKREWFHDFGKGTFCGTCNENHPEPPRMSVRILMDPAFSDSKTEAKKTDRSAIVVVGVTPSPERRMHLLHSVAGRGWDETEVVRRLFALMDVYKPEYVGIEDTSGAKAIIRIFHNEMLNTGRFTPYREIAPAGKAKDARIGPLHHIAQRWGIFVRPGEHNELIEEAVGYGTMQHDDLIEALAYAAEDLYSAGHATVTVPASEQKSSRMTGDDVLAILSRRGASKGLMPWDRVLAGRN